MQITTKAIVPSGVGGADYSTRIATSIVSVGTPSHQWRSLFGDEWLLPTLSYPDLYYLVGGFLDAHGNYVIPIPADCENYIYDVGVSGDTNATSVAHVCLWDNWDPITGILTGLYKTFALKLAPKIVELHFSKGISLREYAGKICALGIAHYSANPNAAIAFYEACMEDTSP